MIVSTEYSITISVVSLVNPTSLALVQAIKDASKMFSTEVTIDRPMRHILLVKATSLDIELLQTFSEAVHEMLQK